jgi:hypothetical protein
MNAISRALTLTFGAGIFVTMFVPKASAGCGDLSNLQEPFEIIQPNADLRAPAAQTEAENASGRSLLGALAAPSVAGMWNFQFLSEGNGSHTPPIPDNALLDFGYQVWHSDGTELTNSGGHNPATQNYCMGVWGKTGFNSYELNHFALEYDGTTGMVNGVANIREQITLSPSGQSLSGTFTVDAYDVKGNKVDHIGGSLTATRVTVDTVVTAIP